MSADDVAKAFCQHYYTTKDSNVAALAGLYNQQSIMTFEGQQFAGTQNIMQKLQSVGQVKHVVKGMDVQPSTSNTAILIFVTGTVQIDNGNPLHFCEMFQLVATAPEAYYVHNDIFRLNYGF
mmetsp:Transcript_3639/g.4346  ORF Transcript_3639/g.4346 Transcript_3639/m.4346 type:complete len:122 (-) Transcript_3639:27-392(-)